MFSFTYFNRNNQNVSTLVDGHVVNCFTAEAGKSSSEEEDEDEEDEEVLDEEVNEEQTGTEEAQSAAKDKE